MNSEFPQSGAHFVPGSMGHTMPQAPKQKGTLATTIAFILLLILLGAGGLYFWGKFVESSETVIYNQN